MNIVGGIAAVEEGDDRYRPALNVGVDLDSFWFGRGFYYGRSFGPVVESVGLIAAGQRFNPFRSSWISAALGVSILNETTSVTYNAPEDQTKNISESRWNAGPFTGIYGNLLGKGPMTLSVGWESAIFPAGVAGGIFLATGRKQFFSIQAGINL